MFMRALHGPSHTEAEKLGLAPSSDMEMKIEVVASYEIDFGDPDDTIPFTSQESWRALLTLVDLPLF